MKLLLAATLLAAPMAAQAQHIHGGDDSGSAVPSHQNHPLDKNAPKPEGKMIDLKVAGEDSKAYQATPKGKAKGAVLVIHEWWGLNDWVKHEADELAKLGYLAVAVDLYKGKVATDPKEAGALMGSKDEKWGAQVEETGVNWLKTSAPGLKVAVIGWCMGGGESLKTALNNAADVNATVMYYGMPVSDPAQLKKLQGPLLGIFAKQDGWITPAKVDEFDKALTTAGIKHEIKEYDADHAFANPSGGKYNGDAAKDAWKKTTAFLAANLK
ncbi:MAG TPA: dienelactone hydrolase family protein [Myxococcales bacterium]|nr:dienelactone hydrolase family protein [Myxococcales bacterium]